MEIKHIIQTVRDARAQAAVQPWMDYDISEIPFAIYDDTQVTYIGHPAPPAERPAQLMAATSVAINGIETATLPGQMCTDEPATVALAYHEGFHVYQKIHFAPLTANMFTAMAFYPDLDPVYRALCQCEVTLLRRDDLLAQEKAALLGAVIQRRREILTQHHSLLPYERYLERSEGTAQYIEDEVRQTLFGEEPTLREVGHGWARFYVVGAALCWLLATLDSEWQSRIAAGESPGDMLIEHAVADLNLATLGYAALLHEATVAVDTLRDEIAPLLGALTPPDALTISYGNGQIMRAFNPSTLLSLEDGRVLHRSFVKLLLPDAGHISVRGAAVDNIAAGEIYLPATEVTLTNGHLHAESETVTVELSGITPIDAQTFTLS